jgi:hypothetical protein
VIPYGVGDKTPFMFHILFFPCLLFVRKLGHATGSRVLLQTQKRRSGMVSHAFGCTGMILIHTSQ